MLKQVRQIVALATARKRDQLPPDLTEDAARGLAFGSCGG
jgi:tRNA U38,U39,U40 pseudouridine synthase TruA